MRVAVWDCVRLAARLTQALAAFAFSFPRLLLYAVQLGTALCRQGWRWLLMTARLVLFGISLGPVIVRVAVTLATSRFVRTNLRYGPGFRQAVDVYHPDGWSDVDGSQRQRYPVIMLVPGGMWTIGYKAWNALLAWFLSRRGFVVVSVDYTNYPQGRISDMLHDIDVAITWVRNNIHAYGGDSNSVCVLGQSAGAHLVSLLLLQQARNGSTHRLHRVKAFVGLSGAFDVDGCLDWWHARGFYRSIVGSIFSHRVAQHSPVRIALDHLTEEQAQLLPPFVLLHGDADQCVPVDSMLRFRDALSSKGVSVRAKTYNDGTHTSPFLEDLIAGRHILVDDIVQVMRRHANTSASGGYSSDSDSELAPKPLGRKLDRRALAPAWLVRLSRRINPF
ncbi:MAG: hypothetical protein MHM6MM_006126 [Cercozoa sp. M6MM]